MSYIMVDIESDGPIPGDYSMICFGAVLVDNKLDKTFFGKLKPISDKFIPEALAVSNYSREETLAFDEPKVVMENFAAWLKAVSPDKPDMFQNFKHLRKTRHTHNPVDDAMGNAEALLTLKAEYALKIKI